jgi:transposase
MNTIAEHTHFVGIDVSMDWLDVHVLPGNLRCRVANGSRGIWSLIGKLSDCEEPLVVMEASGGFEARALETISSAGCKRRFESPQKCRGKIPHLGVR